MKRHFQCAEQVKSPSNLTKYCACHEILKLKIWAETPWSASANRKTIRGYPTISEQNPTIKSSSRTRRFGDLTRPILETILYCKIQHVALRLSPKMSRSAAPATKSPTRTSPNTAPATQNECHQWSASHMKRHFQCVEQVKSPSNITKYCACHAKWTSSMICVTCMQPHFCAEQAKAPCNLTKYCTCHAKCKSSIICVTYATSFPMRGGSKVTVQPHQTLRLPRNLEAQDFSGNSLNASANRKTIRR